MSVASLPYWRRIYRKRGFPGNRRVNGLWLHSTGSAVDRSETNSSTCVVSLDTHDTCILTLSARNTTPLRFVNTSFFCCSTCCTRSNCCEYRFAATFLKWEQRLVHPLTTSPQHSVYDLACV